MIQKGKYPVEYIGITQYYSEKHPALDIGWDTARSPWPPRIRTARNTSSSSMTTR